MFFRRFSFKYSFADFLSIIFLQIFFRIFSRRFSFEYSFADFLSNNLLRIFFRIFFRRFSLKLPRASLKAMKALIPVSTFPQRRFLLKNSSWIFSRKFIRGFSFTCSFTDFFSKILSRIFFQLFFGGFSFKYGNARPYKKSVDGGSFWWNSFPGLHKKQWKL